MATIPGAASVADVRAAVERGGYDIGLASTYRTLELLIGLGLARKRSSGSDEAGYH